MTLWNVNIKNQLSKCGRCFLSLQLRGDVIIKSGSMLSWNYLAKSCCFLSVQRCALPWHQSFQISRNRFFVYRGRKIIMLLFLVQSLKSKIFSYLRSDRVIKTRNLISNLWVVCHTFLSLLFRHLSHWSKSFRNFLNINLYTKMNLRN